MDSGLTLSTTVLPVLVTFCAYKAQNVTNTVVDSGLTLSTTVLPVLVTFCAYNIGPVLRIYWFNSMTYLTLAPIVNLYFIKVAFTESVCKKKEFI